ncbi:DUF7674 family protein [Rufibacter hautae]|uniref:DUF7674 domain-containing protein n=1 Tax=Rufibacter hautae TaxID=2595005 RepID=A0A5B6TJC8_9BACT|nr:hypothetical protein [Rufibacter hautae]KAA3440782.1 hypothetical protein FOA19_09090 [Rufibacter hautae]
MKTEFPQIEQLPVWSKYDWKKEPAFHSIILSDIAREMVNWAKKGDYVNVKRLMDYMESAFINGSFAVQAYLGTDFTVSILETKEKEVRDKIKSLMGPETTYAYKLNLNGYREPN